MTLPQSPGGCLLHRKHAQHHLPRIPDEITFIRLEADRYAKASSESQLEHPDFGRHLADPELLIDLYPTNPPIWALRAVDRLLVDQEVSG
jgi:hypothetical protein